MDFPYGGDPVYRVFLLDKNDAVPSPRVVKLAVAFQLSGPGCHLGIRTINYNGFISTKQ